MDLKRLLTFMVFIGLPSLSHGVKDDLLGEPDVYRENYFKVRSGITLKEGVRYKLVMYLENLAKREEEDDRECLKEKAKEISYFITTGGAKPVALAEAGQERNDSSFRGIDEKLTNPVEYEVLQRALIFAGIVHDLPKLNESPLNALAIRRGYGHEDEERYIQAHLLEAQRIILSARALMLAGRSKGKEFVGQLKRLYDNEFIPVLRNYASEGAFPRERAAEHFAKYLTKEFAKRVREVHEQMTFLSSDQYDQFLPFGVLTCFTIDVLQDYVRRICLSDGRDQDIDVKHATIQVKLRNTHTSGLNPALTATRDEKGVITLETSSEIKLGDLTFEPGASYVYPIQFQRGGLRLSKYQSNADFKASFVDVFPDMKIIEDAPSAYPRGGFRGKKVL